MTERENKLNLVREILRSPLFQSKSLDEQQAVLDQIIATGEISRYEILELIQQEVQQPIINNSKLKPEEVNYLENLPYDVFLNIIYTGKLEGEDLIRLCNTSSVINEKCNRSFSLQGSNRRGTVIAEIETIPQYMFYQLLKRMGIEPSLEKFNQGEDYRQQYLKASHHKAFFPLSQKFKIFEDITTRYGGEGEREGVIPVPGNLFDLFYNEESYAVGLLGDIRYPSKIPIPEQDDYNYNLQIMSELYDFRNYAISPILDEENDDGWKDALKVKADLNIFAELLGMSLDQFINDILIQDYIRNLQRAGYFHMTDPNVIASNFLNANDNFVKALQAFYNVLQLSDKRIEEEIIKSWRYLINRQINYVRGNLMREIEEEIRTGQANKKINGIERDLNQLVSLFNLTDHELDYLLYLHKKILKGILPVITPFTYDDLSNY